LAPIGGYDLVSWTVVAVFAIGNLVLLLSESRRLPRLLAGVRRALARISGRPDLEWLDWWPVVIGMAVVYASVVVYGVLSGQYACSAASDGYGLVASGRAFWAGQNPFTTSICGGVHEIPYGLAAVLIDALGSLGGIVGIYAVWGAISFAFLPLAWWLGGSERRWVLLYLATSVLFLPLVTTQIDGATNTIVPVTVVLALYLARRRQRLAAIAGGLLSTARFPNVFVQAGVAGTERRDRAAGLALVVGAFAGLTGVAYLRWGSEFLGPVILSQIGRRSFSLNLYGPLLFANALPSSGLVEGIQAALTLALLGAVLWRVRTPLLSATIVLTGLALVTPFLSFDILVWLLPVALVGPRPRWWLWAIGVVGAVNYQFAYLIWASADGVTWPSSVLDIVLTALLLALFVELWRENARLGHAPSGLPGGPATDG
jgi:hypothetical protein